MSIQFNHITIDGYEHANQDAFLAPVKIGDSTWCAIADGVGGRSGGREASRICISFLNESLDEKSSMKSVFRGVSDRLSEFSMKNEELRKLSSTLTVLQIKNGKGFFGHVGDTRITHIREKGIMTRTKDQTEVQKLLDDGVISKYQARRYPRKNVLLSAMNAKKNYDLLEGQFDLLPTDRILLTTDGFHSKLLRQEVLDISIKNPEFDKFWEQLSNSIENVKLDDDATCLGIQL